LDEILLREVYAQPALAPASAWLGSAAPGKPIVSLPQSERSTPLRIDWSSKPGDYASLWLLQVRRDGVWTTEILPRTRLTQSFSGQAPEVVSIRAVDRIGNLSPPATLALKQPPQQQPASTAPDRKPRPKARKLAAPKQNV
jgi:hypothetical protein